MVTLFLLLLLFIYASQYLASDRGSALWIYVDVETNSVAALDFILSSINLPLALRTQFEHLFSTVQLVWCLPSSHQGQEQLVLESIDVYKKHGLLISFAERWNNVCGFDMHLRERGTSILHDEDYLLPLAVKVLDASTISLQYMRLFGTMDCGDDDDDDDEDKQSPASSIFKAGDASVACIHRVVNVGKIRSTIKNDFHKNKSTLVRYEIHEYDHYQSNCSIILEGAMEDDSTLGNVLDVVASSNSGIEQQQMHFSSSQISDHYWPVTTTNEASIIRSDENLCALWWPLNNAEVFVFDHKTSENATVHIDLRCKLYHYLKLELYDDADDTISYYSPRCVSFLNNY